MSPQIIGGNLMRIETHQDKKFIKFLVTEFSDASKVHDVIFSNLDGSAIKIDFSYVDLGITYDHDDGICSLGEFE